MKKGCIVILVLLLLLPSCQRAAAMEQTLSSAMARIKSAIATERDFVLADEDFTADNIGSPSYLKESAVCFGTEGKPREFGVFRLSDRTKAAEFKERLRAYLKNEHEALSTLADLYPTEEIKERLDLYENATVGNEGMLVYYFVLDKKETKKALEALTGR